MMGIPPSEARKLSWWEYQAVLSVWNERHSPDDTSDTDAPDADMVALQFERLAARGLVNGSVH